MDSHQHNLVASPPLTLMLRELYIFIGLRTHTYNRAFIGTSSVSWSSALHKLLVYFGLYKNATSIVWKFRFPNYFFHNLDFQRRILMSEVFFFFFLLDSPCNLGQCASDSLSVKVCSFSIGAIRLCPHCQMY